MELKTGPAADKLGPRTNIHVDGMHPVDTMFDWDDALVLPRQRCLVTRKTISLNTGALDASTSGEAKTPDIVSAQGFRVACSLLSGAGALLASTPSQAAIIYSGPKNITYKLPATCTDEGQIFCGITSAGGEIPDPLFGGSTPNAEFGWLGVANDANFPILLVAPPLGLAGEPIAPGSQKTQLASYSTGESIGPAANYKTQQGSTPALLTFFITGDGSEPDKTGTFTTDWQLGTTAFAGLRADVPGGYNYGWMRFTTPSNLNADAPLTLVDWAYETDLNTPILAGAGVVPSPAPLPALGAAAALAASRRLRRRVKQAKADGLAAPID